MGWYTGADPHVTCSLPMNPYHVVTCLISSLILIFKILNSFGFFKEPDCNLFDHSTFSETPDTEELSVAPTRVSVGFSHPWPPCSCQRVVLLVCASAGPTVKMLIGVALLTGGGRVLRNGFHC